MSIKCVSPDKIKPKNDYPKIMIGPNGEIVLFISSGKGIVINNLNNKNNTVSREIGHYSNNWNIRVFIDYDKPVTIQNKTME
jgi:hypothetical protein